MDKYFTEEVEMTEHENIFNLLIIRKVQTKAITSSFYTYHTGKN
jgi:hypothetical protein